MNKLVKIKWSIDARGSSDEITFWHLVVNECGSDMTFCEGQVFEFGDTSAVFETKSTNRGGITCPACLAKIRAIKAVKL